MSNKTNIDAVCIYLAQEEMDERTRHLYETTRACIARIQKLEKEKLDAAAFHLHKQRLYLEHRDKVYVKYSTTEIESMLYICWKEIYEGEE